VHENRPIGPTRIVISENRKMYLGMSRRFSLVIVMSSEGALAQKGRQAGMPVGRSTQTSHSDTETHLLYYRSNVDRGTFFTLLNARARLSFEHLNFTFGVSR